MSAISPFREDQEITAATQTVPFEFEAVENEGETWYPRETSASPFAETVTAEPEAEEWEEFDFGEAEAEAETAHPILRLFPVPGAVLEALGSGLSSVAVGLAINAGYRDVTQLTNIVFYFRHPDLIGRKIRPDQQALAKEWIAIRDRIVKPALQSAPATPAAPAAPTAPAAPVAAPAALSADRLVWPGHSAEELAFMKAVYNEQRRTSKGDFVMDLPEGALDRVEGYPARKDAAAAVQPLLREARAALAREHPNAQIGIISAYRSATEQFRIWQGRDPRGTDKGSGFPYYYRQAKAERVVSEGDFSRAAVERMAQYMHGFIASPGYSNHQDGLAFDFGTGVVGKGVGKIGWGSWFRKWLKKNAARHHFFPIRREAWHWVYRPPGAASEVWSEELVEEVRSPAVAANRIEVERVPLLARHRGVGPDLVLRWNDMPVVPEAIDVVVHLHGFWYPRLRLPRDIEPVSGLDLAPIKGADGKGRTRPTLTVLPRGNDTGVKQTHGSYNAYTFPALVTQDGIDQLVRFALERFAATVRGPAPRVGRLILSAHSGGGDALLKILRHHDPHQVHVFDALYWDAAALVDWARRRIRKDRDAIAAGAAADYMATQGGALRVFYQGRYRGGTRPRSLAVRKALASELGGDLGRWYRVEASKYDHFQIPRRYGWRVLQDASADVPDAYVEATGQREAELDVERLAFEEPEDAGSDVAAAESAEPEWEPEVWAEEEEEEVAGPESAEPEWEPEGWAEEEEEEDFGSLDEAEEDEAEYDLTVAEAVDLVAEPEVVEVEPEEEGVESPEVERAEADEFFAGEVAFEEEAPAGVTFPSGAMLAVVPGPTGPGEEHFDPNQTGNPLLDTSAKSTRLTANFTVGELVHSGGKTFDKARIDPELVRCLQKLRDHVGKAVRITSGYRPYLYNADLYANKYKKKPTLSRHSSGQAADVHIAGMTGMEIAKAAIDACGPAIAVGIDATYAHIDVRGKWARWTYFEQDKARSDRAIAELDAYRRQRLGGARAPASVTGGGPVATPTAPQGRLEGFTAAEEKALRLTTVFETGRPLGYGGLTGNFDGMGVSFGLLQWNIGSGSLQPLLQAFDREAPQAFDAVFGAQAGELRQVLARPLPDQLAWARRINDAKHRIVEPWRSHFERLSADPTFRRIQLRVARKRMDTARTQLRELGLRSERALALIFDNITQNGPAWRNRKRRAELIVERRRAEEARLGRPLDERGVLAVIANVVADTVKPEYRENVRARRMTIVNGVGRVHGRDFDLARDFQLSDAPAE